MTCGGECCNKCNACRDWYFDRESGDTIKRSNAKCIHENIFAHDLVRNANDETFYPVGRLICECPDNH